MTDPERTIDAGEEDRAQVHARVSARQAVMKGMDREALADAFMLEAIKLTFGVEDAEAARLAQRWKEQTFRMLDADYVTRAGARRQAEGRAFAAAGEPRAAYGKHRVGARELTARTGSCRLVTRTRASLL